MKSSKIAWRFCFSRKPFRDFVPECEPRDPGLIRGLQNWMPKAAARIQQAGLDTQSLSSTSLLYQTWRSCARGESTKLRTRRHPGLPRRARGHRHHLHPRPPRLLPVPHQPESSLSSHSGITAFVPFVVEISLNCQGHGEHEGKPPTALLGASPSVEWRPERRMLARRTPPSPASLRSFPYSSVCA